MDTGMLKKFLGKKCYIYTVAGNTEAGTVTEVTDSFIEITNKNGKITAINCEFLSSIKEC